jgi:hypothetical protein
MRDAPLPEAHKATTFQLNENSVSPTRLINRDEDGNEIEETVSCYPHREMFVDKAGNICEVVLCNSRTSSRNNEARMYAAQVRLDWLRNAGLPLKECPHAPSTEYKRELGTEVLVKAPSGYKGCAGGKVDADGKITPCEHLKAIIDSRLKKTRDAHEKQEARAASMTSGQLEQMGRVFGDQIANAMGSARNNLVNGRGEKD